MTTSTDKPRVLVLDDNLDVARDLAPWERLTDKVTLEFVNQHFEDDDALIERISDATVLVVMRERTPLTRERIERLPNLQLVVTKGMHNASIDLAAAADHDVTVSGTPGRPDAPVEITWALILALARNLCAEHQNMRKGGWQLSLGIELRGRTLGIVGLGRLGSEVARIGQAFGMNLIAWSPNMTAERAMEHGALAVERDELLETADFVTLHLKLSERSQGIIGADQLARMKSSAFLINTSRGPLVDEAALLQALTAGQIAGAGLDVYDHEPLPGDHPLRSVENVVLTPHLGYHARDSYSTHFGLAIENIDAWLSGAPVRLLPRA